MIDPFLRSLTGDASHPEVRVERRYAASPDRVWSALTSPGRLARWLGEVRGAPQRVGDAFTVAFADAPERPARGRVTSCEPDRRLVVEWNWEGEAPSTVEVELTTDGEGCRVALTHRLGEAAHVPDYGGGWERCLRSLAALHGDDVDGDLDEAAAAARWRDMLARTLCVELALPARAVDIWRSLTTVEGLRSWWWDHWDDVEIAIDPREGRPYRFAAPGAGIAVSGRFLTVEEGRRLAYTWRWEDADGVSRDEACDLVLHDDDAGGCRLVLRHTGPWSDDAPAESYRQGWGFTLGRLTAVAGTVR